MDVDYKRIIRAATKAKAAIAAITFNECLVDIPHLLSISSLAHLLT